MSTHDGPRTDFSDGHGRAFSFINPAPVVDRKPRVLYC